ncbi:hypothetical protein R6Z07F_018615 [Ovis aries]
MEQPSQTSPGYEFPTSCSGSLPAVAVIDSPFHSKTLLGSGSRGLGLQAFLVAHGSRDRLTDEVETEAQGTGHSPLPSLTPNLQGTADGPVLAGQLLPQPKSSTCDPSSTMTQEPHAAAPLPKAPEKGLQAQEAPQRLPKDEEEEEEMRKAALSFPGPPGKSHLPGSPSPDHSTSPLEPARS